VPVEIRLPSQFNQPGGILKFCERVVSRPPAHIVIEPVGTRNVRLNGGYAALLMVLTLMLLVVMRSDVRLPEMVRALTLPELMFEAAMVEANTATDDTLDVMTRPAG